MVVEKFWSPRPRFEAASCFGGDFPLPQHMLQKVKFIEKPSSSGSRLNVELWNDSKVTNLHSSEAALDFFNETLILIFGVKSKNEDIESSYINILRAKAKFASCWGKLDELLFVKNHE
jgi:hypothetical protein